MSVPKILVFAGSIRTGSFNGRLAALAAKELALAGAEVTRISLEDYPMPIYDGDDETKSGVPANARNLKAMLAAHQGVFIASPEYNASVTPLLKNTIDWISRVRERGEPPLAVFKQRVFALGGASDSGIPAPAAGAATPLPVPPRVQVSYTATDLTVTLTGGRGPFTLQRRADLNPGTQWQDAGALSGNSITITNAITGAQGYYRIRGQ